MNRSYLVLGILLLMQVCLLWLVFDIRAKMTEYSNAEVFDYEYIGEQISSNMLEAQITNANLASHLKWYINQGAQPDGESKAIIDEQRIKDVMAQAWINLGGNDIGSVIGAYSYELHYYSDAAIIKVFMRDDIKIESYAIVPFDEGHNWYVLTYNQGNILLERGFENIYPYVSEITNFSYGDELPYEVLDSYR